MKSSKKTFTKFDNSIMETVMMNKIFNERSRVFFCILRQTSGFKGREWASITPSLFRKITGISERNIWRSIKELEDANFIRRKKGKKGWEYSIMTSDLKQEVTSDLKQDYFRSEADLLQSGSKVTSDLKYEDSSISRDTSDSKSLKKDIKENYKEKGKERGKFPPELSKLLAELEQYPCFEKADPQEVKKLLETFPSSQIIEEARKAFNYLIKKDKVKGNKWRWFIEKWMPQMTPEEEPFHYPELPEIPSLCKA